MLSETTTEAPISSSAAQRFPWKPGAPSMLLSLSLSILTYKMGTFQSPWEGYFKTRVDDPQDVFGVGASM